MNINSIGRTLEIYQNSIPTRSVSQAAKPTSKGNDSMTLSETAKDFKTVLDALKTAPDVRTDKVSNIKEQIASNNYNVSAEDISERILRANFDAIG